MRGNGLLGIAALLLTATLGCRTGKPELKPIDSPEALNMPPNENRFDSPRYPKQALQKDDPFKKLMEERDMVVPTRGITSQR